MIFQRWKPLFCFCSPPRLCSFWFFWYSSWRSSSASLDVERWRFARFWAFLTDSASFADKALLSLVKSSIVRFKAFICLCSADSSNRESKRSLKPLIALKAVSLTSLATDSDCSAVCSSSICVCMACSLYSSDGICLRFVWAAGVPLSMPKASAAMSCMDRRSWRLMGMALPVLWFWQHQRKCAWVLHWKSSPSM